MIYQWAIIKIYNMRIINMVMNNTYYVATYIHLYTKIHTYVRTCVITRQMLTTSWGEPDVIMYGFIH